MVAGDLGSAGATSQTSTCTDANTRRWCPPELLDPERFGSKGDGPTKKGDVYSMGMTIYEVLTDKIPFYESNDHMVILDILQGVRPKKPDFHTTRGYTEELWQMTMCCWEEDPSSRPTVDHVLDALRNAAEHRESKQEEVPGLSPWDDWNPTLMEESDPPTAREHEDGPATAAASVPPKSLQPPIIKTPLPAPAPPTPTPIPSMLIPSTAKDKVPPKSDPVTSNDMVKPMPVSPPRLGKERKQTPATSKKEETKEEELLTPTWTKGKTRPALPAPNLSGSTLQTAPNPSGPRPTPDEVVDRLLDRAKTPLGEGEARKVVEVAEKVSGTRLPSSHVNCDSINGRQMLQPQFKLSLRTRTRCFRGLVKICGEYGILPNSCVIPEYKVQKLGDSTTSCSGFSDIWPGAYEEDIPVAIEVVRNYGSDDIRKIRKVRFIDLLSSSRSSLIICRIFAGRS